jgi:hypothetical protein
VAEQAVSPHPQGYQRAGLSGCIDLVHVPTSPSSAINRVPRVMSCWSGSPSAYARVLAQVDDHAVSLSNAPVDRAHVAADLDLHNVWVVLRAGSTRMSGIAAPLTIVVVVLSSQNPCRALPPCVVSAIGEQQLQPGGAVALGSDTRTSVS